MSCSLKGTKRPAASRRAPAPRVGVEHQRDEPGGLGLGGREPGGDAAEPDRLFREIAAARVLAEGLQPTVREGGIDRLQHRADPLRPQLRRGLAKRHAGLTDARLGARQPLTHGGGRDEKRRGDRRGVEPEDRLQHQRRPDGRLDRGMRAGEHQRKPPVGERALADLREFIGNQRERALGLGRRLSPPRRVGETAARGDDQPTLGVGGSAVARPGFERGGEGVAERVLRRRHVAIARREIGDEPAVAVARDAGGLARARLTYIGQIARTSMVP